MKPSRYAVLLSLCCTALSVAPAEAGFIDWFLPHRADWKFVQSTGGIRILPPERANGKVRLPIMYDASGSSQITCKPSAENTGLIVDKIKVKRERSHLVIRVLTLPVKDTGSTEGMGRLHYADLTDLPPGTYDVYYANADDPAAWLGQIELKGVAN